VITSRGPLTEFGVESGIEDEDYLQGLVALQKAW